MYLYCILVAFTTIQLTYTADDTMKDSRSWINCYKCVSTSKKPVPDCELKMFPKDRELKDVKMNNCTRAVRGQMPKCFTAIGQIKENKNLINVTIRDCGTIVQHVETKCIYMDFFKLRGFNGCVEACDKDNCNSAQHLTGNNINFLIQLFMWSMVVCGLSNKWLNGSN